MFPFPHQLVIKVLLNIMEKPKKKYVLPSFTSCVTCTTSFDLMNISCHGHDTFAMVVNLINNLWESTHVIVGIFEVHNMVGVAMVNQVKVLLDFFGLFDKIIVYVKDKRSNLNILNLVLTNVVTCFFFQLTNPFCGTLFWPCHVKGMLICL